MPAIGSFFQLFSSSDKTARGNQAPGPSNSQSQRKDPNNNSSNNEDLLLIKLRDQHATLPSPPSDGGHPAQASQQQRARLRSILSSLSSSSPRTNSILVHPDPIRIALQPSHKDNHHQTAHEDSAVTQANPSLQPSSDISSALSRALSTTLSRSFSRTPAASSANPLKKWLGSKHPPGPSTAAAQNSHPPPPAAAQRHQSILLKKKKSTPTGQPELLGIGSADHHQPMKKHPTSTSFLNLITKKQQQTCKAVDPNEIRPVDHLPHLANSLVMKSRSHSIVQADRAHLRAVPKILTAAARNNEQQPQLSQERAPHHLLLLPDPATHQAPPPLPHPSPPPQPQPLRAQSSFYFNHHLPDNRDPAQINLPEKSNPSTESQASDPTKNARKTSSRYALADFDLIRTLGTGSFGRVHLSKSRHNGRGYAIKVLNKKRVVGLKQVEHTNSERQMLAAVRHPFLVNLWGTFADSYNLYMVMDFVSGGELFNLLRKSQRFPDPVAKFFGAEVALALDYLHCLDIVYRDLKPENILLGSDGHIKITDFGFAKLVPDITWTLCGTPDYLAPEIVQSKGYNKSVDWYALGVLIFEMLAGYPPFYCEEESPMRLYEKIIAGKVRYPSYFNPSAKDLLKSLLTSDLSKRFGNLANGSRDIFHHAWFAEVDWERLYRKQIPAPYVPRVSSEWDASNFDHYDEASLEEYGKVGEDPYGHLFPGF
ncbi:hypothetical protein PtA15_4A202 [Puccinia triticina]|uniref:cAMP-dependent protein kinase n=1 Tax=Puccinia triticina TaxID=208348 RepID=A0ABY7CGH2_9BASI|nr:uncharacterized protein PtA15_4A202 [Puccinia triticina]WAQ83754.1 hypothetical protein PtA15_4A202 [Puccinia triticina]